MQVSAGARVACGCEPPDVDAENWIQSSYKSSKRSQLLSHLAIFCASPLGHWYLVGAVAGL